MAHRELRRSVLSLVLLATLVLAGTRFAHGSRPPPSSSRDGQQIGRILSVRKVLGNRYFVSRYPQIHYYLLYFAVRVPGQTNCAEYETPVLDEIDDLFAAKDKDVEFVLKGKSLTPENAEGPEAQGPLSGTEAALTASALTWLARVPYGKGAVSARRPYTTSRSPFSKRHMGFEQGHPSIAHRRLAVPRFRQCPSDAPIVHRCGQRCVEGDKAFRPQHRCNALDPQRAAATL